MTLPARRSLPHIPPPCVQINDAIFFITIGCTPRAKNQLCQPDVARPLFESVAFRNERRDWWIDLLLLMPDHLHALGMFPHDKQMSKIVSDWKHNAASKFGIVWQRDFFDHRLRGEEGWR